MADNKPKKTLYHSELVTLGPVKVLIKSEVTPSKYKGKPPYVTLILDGIERQYWTENQRCETAMRGYKDRQVMLEASGSREDADIKILGGSAREGDGRGQAGRDREPENRNADRNQGRDDRSQRAPEREHQRHDPTPPPREERREQAKSDAAASRVDVVGAKRRILQLANLRLLCTEAAHYYFDQYRLRRRSSGAKIEEDMTTEAMFTNAVAGLTMGAEREGLHHMMPAEPLPLPKPAQTPQSQPK